MGDAVMIKEYRVAYVMIGVAGSGKSTLAKTYQEKEKRYGNEVTILSSDSIRLELFGDLKHHEKEHHQLVFKTLDERKSELIKKGQAFIIDATNTSIKSRAIQYKELKKQGYEVINVYVGKNLTYLKHINETREIEKRVPIEVVERQYINLQPPIIHVDCDAVIVAPDSGEFLSDRVDFKYKQLRKFIRENTNKHVKDIIKNYVSDYYLPELERIAAPHDTPYHLEPIGEHISMVATNMLDYVERAELSKFEKEVLLVAAIYHDLGKSVTKDGGRYFGHANVSAQYLLSSVGALITSDSTRVIDKALLIVQTHMDAKQDLSDKYIKRYNMSLTDLDLVYRFREVDNESRIGAEEVL